MENTTNAIVLAETQQKQAELSAQLKPMPLMQSSQQFSIIEDLIKNNQVEKKLQAIEQFQKLLNARLKPNIHYGKIEYRDKRSGKIKTVADKNMLYKAGAEVISSLMGLEPTYAVEKTEDWENGFFYFSITCTLLKNGHPVTRGMGICSSKEKKMMPSDYQTQNLKTAEKEKFLKDYACDRVHNIMKMAKKRAFVDAVMYFSCVSDIFEPEMTFDGIDIDTNYNNDAMAEDYNDDYSLCLDLVTAANCDETLKTAFSAINDLTDNKQKKELMEVYRKKKQELGV